MTKPPHFPFFHIGRRVRDLLLASAFAFGAIDLSHAAPTKAECLEKAKADYDAAISACSYWASDRDPYITCLNDAYYAHQGAAGKCQKIIRRPPALPPVDKPVQKAPSR